MKQIGKTSRSYKDEHSRICISRSRQRSGIQFRRYANDIIKELVRKSIHMCTALIPFLLSHFYYPVIMLLILTAVLYTAAEIMRMKGRNVPFFSAVTQAAARKRDENKFVLGPVTLTVGVIVTAVFFDPLPAAAGIYALAFGDGLASLTGKLLGRISIPFTNGKTVIGSLTCFCAIFVSSFLTLQNTCIALVLAAAGMFIELIPLKDFDNLLIPVFIAGAASYLLF